MKESDEVKIVLELANGQKVDSLEGKKVKISIENIRRKPK
jgi:hypothetical protein